MTVSPLRPQSRGRPSRLSRDDLQLLRLELARKPSDFGFARQQWSGRLLAAHLLANHGVVLGPRQCCRILRSNGQLQAVNNHCGRNQTARKLTADRAQPAHRAIPASDRANKERALVRIKRICSSGLPLYPLARALFELMNDAIPHCDNRVLLADDGGHPDRYITSSSELAAWGPVHRQLFIESPPEVSGTISMQDILGGKPVLRHEEMALPHFYRSAGYNECMRHLGFHHALLINLRDQVEQSGHYPMWRGADMKEFSEDDVRFAKAAAPYLAHALRTAARIGARSGPSSEFIPLRDWGEGVLILGRGCRVVGADATARAIFAEIALFEGDSGSLTSNRIQSALAYIQHTMQSLFEGESDPFASFHPPAARLYCHRIGLALKMRGVLIQTDKGEPQTVVLIEAGELAEHRRSRIAFRYGLTPRLMELMDCVAAGLSLSAIAQRMELSRFTVRDYLRRLKERLELTDLAALRRFAIELVHQP